VIVCVCVHNEIQGTDCIHAAQYVSFLSFVSYAIYGVTFILQNNICNKLTLRTFKYEDRKAKRLFIIVDKKTRTEKSKCYFTLI